MVSGTNPARGLSLGLLCAISVLATPLHAQPAATVPTVEVTDIDFDTEDLPIFEEDVYRVGVEFAFGSNPKPDAPNERWIDKVDVTLIIAFVNERSQSIQAYSSTARLVAVEADEEERIFFYLPQEILERDRISGDPYAYLVEFKVDGDDIARPGGDPYDNQSAQTTVENFKSAIRDSLADNAGILMTQQEIDPSRLIPIHREAPTFVPDSRP
ncbi:MAG: hypothetical protein ACFBZ8_01075 [Opitutales bacterium]